MLKCVHGNFSVGYILVMQIVHNLFDRGQSPLTSINQSSSRLLSVKWLCTAPLRSYYCQYRANSVQIQANAVKIQYKYAANTHCEYNTDTIKAKEKQVSTLQKKCSIGLVSIGLYKIRQ